MKTKRGLLAFAILGVMLVLASDPVWAAEQAAQGGYLAGYENTDPRPTSVSFWSTAAYLVSLFAIFAFVVVAAYFVARFLGGHFAKPSSGQGGRMLANLPLGPGRSVCIVEMAQCVVMLGVTEHSITLLREITDPAVIDELEHEAQKSPINTEMFSQQFGTLSDVVRKIPPMFRH
jgi:flagellar protein FliO/FliZ